MILISITSSNTFRTFPSHSTTTTLNQNSKAPHFPIVSQPLWWDHIAMLPPSWRFAQRPPVFSIPLVGKTTTIGATEISTSSPNSAPNIQHPSGTTHYCFPPSPMTPAPSFSMPVMTPGIGITNLSGASRMSRL